MRIPLLDRANVVVRMLDADGVRDWMGTGNVVAIRARGKVKALKFSQKDGAMIAESDELARVTPREGELHRRETWDNVAGVWSFTQIRADRRHFTRVLDSVTRRAA